LLAFAFVDASPFLFIHSVSSYNSADNLFTPGALGLWLRLFFLALPGSGPIRLRVVSIGGVFVGDRLFE